MRKYGLAIVLLAMLLGACSPQGGPAKAADPVLAAFLASRADCTEIRLVGWHKLSEAALDSADMQKEGQKIAAKLSLNIDNAACTAAGGWEQFSLEGEKNGASYRLLLQETEEGTYLIIRIGAAKEISYFAPLKEELIAALGGAGEYNCLIIGELRGRLSGGKIRELFSELLFACQGRLVNTAFEDNYYSVSASLGEGGREVAQANQEVDLQIAADYQEKEDKTVLYFGAPLIYSDY